MIGLGPYGRAPLCQGQDATERVPTEPRELYTQTLGRAGSMSPPGRVIGPALPIGGREHRFFHRLGSLDEAAVNPIRTKENPREPITGPGGF